MHDDDDPRDHGDDTPHVAGQEDTVSTQGTGPDLEARLRAADPAAGAEPDLRALRAAVDARVAAADDAAPASGGRDVQDGQDELSRARRRRRPSWPARVASAAAAALVVGAGGGYAIGAMDDGGGDTSLPALTLTSGGAPTGTMEAAGGAPDMAMDAGGRAEMSAGDMAVGYWGGSWGGSRTLFEHSGLSTDRATARVHGFDPAAAWSAETLRTAAAALGVAGEPRQEGSVWRVGSDDGTGPTVELYGNGMVSLGFWDPTKDVWYCDAVPEPRPLPAPDESGDATTSSDEPTFDIMPVEPCTEQDLGPAPTGDAATAAVRDVLSAMGVDVGSFELVVDGEDTGPWTYVTAHHVLDGRRTGLTWGASLTGAGVASLHGQLAPLVDLGEYEVVSPAEAVERLTDPRFGSGGPVRWLDGREPAWAEPGHVTDGPPATPSAGTDLVWPVGRQTIVEANLGSAMHGTPEGAALLVPTYELIDSQGAVWTVIAVADQHLDMATR